MNLSWDTQPDLGRIDALGPAIERAMTRERKSLGRALSASEAMAAAECTVAGRVFAACEVFYDGVELNFAVARQRLRERTEEWRRFREVFVEKGGVG